MNNDLSTVMVELKYIQSDIKDIKTDIKDIKDSFATREYVDDRVNPISDLLKKVNWLIIASVIGAMMAVVIKFN